MALSRGINYYNKNVLRSLPNWNILNNASISDEYININSGGYVGVDLSNDYFNGLHASKYRLISASIKTDISSLFNYQNFIDIVIIPKYKDNNGNLYTGYYNVNATPLSSKYSSNVLTFTQVVEMENFDLESCVVYVVNHTTSTIQLQYCEMLRSQDISGSQIGGSIGWAITLRKVKAYLDGCELFYDGVEDPDKLWWMEDAEGKFSGINVNNERMIGFDRINEILLD